MYKGPVFYIYTKTSFDALVEESDIFYINKHISGNTYRGTKWLSKGWSTRESEVIMNGPIFSNYSDYKSWFIKNATRYYDVLPHYKVDQKDYFYVISGHRTRLELCEHDRSMAFITVAKHDGQNEFSYFNPEKKEFTEWMGGDWYDPCLTWEKAVLGIYALIKKAETSFAIMNARREEFSVGDRATIALRNSQYLHGIVSKTGDTIELQAKNNIDQDFVFVFDKNRVLQSNTYSDSLDYCSLIKEYNIKSGDHVVYTIPRDETYRTGVVIRVNSRYRENDEVVIATQDGEETVSHGCWGNPFAFAEKNGNLFYSIEDYKKLTR